MKQTRIISAFPASGKTHLFNDGYEDKVIIDSDSSKFSWLANSTKRNPDFPNNYIEHIKENIGKVDYILVSSHIDVRRALDANELSWVFVLPDSALLAEWVARCYMRGDNDDFINVTIENWYQWTSDINDPMPSGIVILRSGEYLKDKMHFIETIAHNS